MLITPTKPIILSLCDFSGRMVHPWKDTHYCVTVDIKYHWTHETSYGLALKADVTQWKYPENWITPEIVFAFPPCTNVAVSGALHFQSKGLGALIESLQILKSCVEICETASRFALLENPVSMFSSYWRKPDFTYEPWHYAGYLDNPREEAYTKTTCLWVFNNSSKIFRMPVIKPCFDYKKNHIRDMGFDNYEDRRYKRSLTPKCFAKAVHEYNK